MASSFSVLSLVKHSFKSSNHAWNLSTHLPTKLFCNTKSMLEVNEEGYPLLDSLDWIRYLWYLVHLEKRLSTCHWMFETVSQIYSHTIDESCTDISSLTLKAQEREQSGAQEQPPTISADKSKDILSLLTTAQEKFQETVGLTRWFALLTSALIRNANKNLIRMKHQQQCLHYWCVFSPRKTPPPNQRSVWIYRKRNSYTKEQTNLSDKTAVSVAELEKQFLQPSPVPQTKTVTTTNKEHLPKPVPFETKVCISASVWFLVHAHLLWFQNQTQAPPLGVSAQIMNHTVPAGHHQVKLIAH